MFEALEELNLSTPKFRMLDQIWEGVSWIGALDFQYVYPFDHFNYVVKKFMRVTSVIQVCTLQDIVRVIACLIDRG